MDPTGTGAGEVRVLIAADRKALVINGAPFLEEWTKLAKEAAFFQDWRESSIGREVMRRKWTPMNLNFGP